MRNLVLRIIIFICLLVLLLVGAVGYLPRLLAPDECTDQLLVPNRSGLDKVRRLDGYISASLDNLLLGYSNNNVFVIDYKRSRTRSNYNYLMSFSGVSSVETIVDFQISSSARFSSIIVQADDLNHLLYVWDSSENNYILSGVKLGAPVVQFQPSDSILYIDNNNDLIQTNLIEQNNITIHQFVFDVSAHPSSNEIVAYITYEGTEIIYLSSNTIRDVFETDISDTSFEIVSSSFSETGRYVILWGRDGVIASSLQERGNEYSVKSEIFITSNAIRQDDNLIAFGGDYRNPLVELRNFPSGEIHSVFSEHTFTVISLDFHPVEETIVSGSLNGEIFVWNTDGSVISSVIPEGGSSLLSVEFNSTGDLIVANYDGFAQLYCYPWQETPDVNSS